jgi:putative transcriptional regulator
LTDAEYAALQAALMADPDAGSVVPGSGSVRKLRWAAPGRGKRGGYRIIYYVRRAGGVIWMLTMYPKNHPTASPHTFCGESARKWTMRKAKRDIGQEILDGLRELKRGETGRVINVPEVASIREKTGLSQSRFAALLGVSVRTLQDWEQGRRAPSGAARTLLLIADRNPHALLEVA